MTLHPLQLVYPKYFERDFRIGNTPIPLPAISLFNRAYLLDYPIDNGIYPSLLNELYDGEFLFIDLTTWTFFNDTDREALYDFLCSLHYKEVNWFLHSNFSCLLLHEYFYDDNENYMSPTFPLTINNHTDLRVNVHTYQIDYSSYDENSTILHYIASLRPQH